MFSPSPSKLTATIPGTQRISPRRQRLNVGKIPKQRYDHQNSHKPNVQGICRPFMRLKISALPRPVLNNKINISDNDQNAAEIEREKHRL